jgi:hypothetical protein
VLTKLRKMDVALSDSMEYSPNPFRPQYRAEEAPSSSFSGFPVRVPSFLKALYGYFGWFKLRSNTVIYSRLHCHICVWPLSLKVPFTDSSNCNHLLVRAPVILSPAPSPALPVTPLTETTLSNPTGQHLKPARPTRYSRRQGVTRSKTDLLGQQLLCIDQCKVSHVFYYLNTNFTDEATIWFRYHYQEDQAETLT